jgi:multiple sugar transport system substrate-binding protein
LFNEIADAFIKENPDVSKVTFESITLSDLTTVLPTQLSSNDPPDASWLPVEQSIEYIDAGALVDLMPTMKAMAGYDVDDLVTRFQEPWRRGDAQYGIPFSTGPLIFYYNKDLWAEAGLTDPADEIAAGNWTWDTLRADMKQLTEKTGKMGLVLDAFEFKTWVRLLPLMRAYGSVPWDSTGTVCEMESAEMVATMQALHDMIYVDKIMPQPGQQADFWGGNAGATIAYLSTNTMLKDATYEYGIVPTPSGPGGAGQAVGQSAIVAYAAGKHVDAASRLVAFMTNKENAAKLSAYFPPSRTSLMTAESFAAASPLLSEDQLQVVINAIVKDGEFVPVTAHGSDAAAALNAALDKYAYGTDADIPSAMTQACDALTPIISK